MKFFKFLIIIVFFIVFEKIRSQDINNELMNDHEKAIKAVNEGEILTLDQILEKVNRNFEGRIISINLKDNEKGLFGWVYDIMIIDVNNKVKQIRIDAGTSTVLSVISGN
tara:strand:- start:71 stop:400 length:330 start_codon:yes stop_codon:yes gene_type:complete